MPGNEDGDDVVRAQKTERFTGVPRDALWRFIAETDGLNREIGLPPVNFTFRPRDEGGSYLRGNTKIAGQTFRYDEEPYCWVKPSRWSVRRIIDNGPLEFVQPGVVLSDDLDDDGTSIGTRVTATFACAPRNFLTLPIARQTANASVGTLLKRCRHFADALAAQTDEPRAEQIAHAMYNATQVGKAPTSKVHAARLAEAQAALLRQSAHERFVARLVSHLSHAPAPSLLDMRPYVLADQFFVPRRDALRASLLAVRAGLLDLRWRIFCPACKGPDASASNLTALKGEAHCPSCNVRYDAEFDQNVEVCFSVAPRIRNIVSETAGTFCIGGPERSPQLDLQWFVPAGESVALDVDLASGACRLWSPQAIERVPVTLRAAQDNGGGQAATIRIIAHDRRAEIVLHDANAADNFPARGVWNLRNETAFPVLFRVERDGWRTDAATAATVTTMQTFRNLFASEVLSLDTEMAVRQVAILFSDLKGSTAMYAERGDAPSYAAVRDHFTFLRDIIDENSGAVIKTIGDAVMAAFPDAADALRAALAIQEQTPRAPQPFVVKLGLHAGPALAVNANDNLDYFGQIVNTAARVQSESIGGDIVIARSLAHDDEIATLLDGKRIEPFTKSLRGLAEPVELLRIWP